MKKEYDFSRGRRGPVISNGGKARITIHLENAILECYKAESGRTGTGYQTLINESLAKSVGIRDMTDKPRRPIKRRQTAPNANCGDSPKEPEPTGQVGALLAKRQLAKELADGMKSKKISIQQMARQLNTTSTQIARLLDSDSTDVAVDVLFRAALVIGRTLHISLTDGKDG